MIERVRVLEPDDVIFNADDFVAFDDITFLVNLIIDGRDPAAGLTPDGPKFPFTDGRGRGASPGLIERLMQEEWIALPGVDPITTVIETVPLWALYELSIWLSVLMERRQPAPREALL